jgi:hypothetical protein
MALYRLGFGVNLDFGDQARRLALRLKINLRANLFASPTTELS